MPQAKVHSVTGRSGKAFLMTGDAADGSGDPAHGALIILSHNSPGNRQFTLANSENGKGARFIDNYIDRYNFFTQARDILFIGTETHGAKVVKQLDVVGPMISGIPPIRQTRLRCILRLAQKPRG